MANIVGTPENDLLVAVGSGDRLFGLAGDDVLRSGFADAFMNGGRGDDQLQQRINLQDVVSYEDVSFYKAGSGNDRVVLRTNVEGGGVAGPDEDETLSVDQTILTESGDDFVFIENRLSADIENLGFSSAFAKLRLVDLIGDNRIVIKNDLETVITFASVNSEVILGRGDDNLRYDGSVFDFSSGTASDHVFDLGDGNNRFVFREDSGYLNFDLTSGAGRDVLNIFHQMLDPNSNGSTSRFDISTGDGDDQVIFEVRSSFVTNEGVLTAIDLGDGDNFLRLTQTVAGPVTVTAGDGDDRVDVSTFSDVIPGILEVPTPTFLDLGDGDNRVTTDLRVGSGFDVMDFNLVTGDGRDRIDFDVEFLMTSAPDDLVDGFSAVIDTGAGNDQINIGFADLTLTTGVGADIVRFDKSAITEPRFSSTDPLVELNPGQNTVILTDFDFESGDRFILTGFDLDGADATIRSVEALQALAGMGDALDVSVNDGSLVLELAGEDGVTSQIVFEELALGEELDITPIDPDDIFLF